MSANNMQLTNKVNTASLQSSLMENYKQFDYILSQCVDSVHLTVCVTHNSIK